MAGRGGGGRVSRSATSRKRAGDERPDERGAARARNTLDGRHAVLVHHQVQVGAAV